MRDVDSIERALRACSGGSLVSVAAVFLHHCRQHRGELERLLCEPEHHHQRNQVCLAARAFFEALDADEVEAEDVAALIAELRSWCERLPPALVASGFAYG